MSWMERDGASELPYMAGEGGGRTSSRITRKNFHQTLLGDQWGSMIGTLLYWDLHCWKVREIPGYGWALLPCQVNCMLPIAAASLRACFSFSALSKKHSKMASAHGIGWFHWALDHQIAECTWACPTPLVYGWRDDNANHSPLHFLQLLTIRQNNSVAPV